MKRPAQRSLMNTRNIGAQPLRTPGNLLLGKSIFIFAATLALSPLASAQQSSEQPTADQPVEEQRSSGDATERGAPRKDYYRAEFVILERKVEPDEINERMASRIPEPPNPDITDILRATDGNGTVETTLDLVPRSELHLNSAANRLENSGKYRVLLATGWYQSFPPDFEGEPLRVAIGDWLSDAGHREVDGHITIDRQRYLHVGVHLNHWRPLPTEDKPVGLIGGGLYTDRSPDTDGSKEADGNEGESAGAENAEAAGNDSESAQAVDVAESVDQPGQALISGVNWPRAELLTWIRETRRMRSEEVHFLDSPTIGVLVFFRKIEE